VVCAEENPDWLAPYIGPNQGIVTGPRRQSRILVQKIFGKNWIKIWGGGYRKLANIMNKFKSENQIFLGRVDLRCYYDRLNVKLVHVFPQIYVQANQPIIFNPHDLQHEHFPEFFSAEELSRRKYSYFNACREATVVVAGSQYTKNDVINQYGISPDRIVVIPLAPATEAYGSIEVGKEQEVLTRYAVPSPFILYPAVTWPHKNHIRLLKAINLLRAEGLKVNLVCTGKKVDPSWNELKEYLKVQELSDQVKFLGFISGKELRYLYSNCLFVVAPSLFEEHSGPMWETWQEGAAIACSNITSLPEQAGNAALIFDPYSVESIAAAIRSMWEDETLRTDLKNFGRIRLRDFSWEKTSKAYRALYRLIAGYPMTNEDFNMLEMDWMSGMKNQQVSRQINHKLDG